MNTSSSHVSGGKEQIGPSATDTEKNDEVAITGNGTGSEQQQQQQVEEGEGGEAAAAQPPPAADNSTDAALYEENAPSQQVDATIDVDPTILRKTRDDLNNIASPPDHALPESGDATRRVPPPYFMPPYGAHYPYYHYPPPPQFSDLGGGGNVVDGRTLTTWYDPKNQPPPPQYGPPPPGYHPGYNMPPPNNYHLYYAPPPPLPYQPHWGGYASPPPNYFPSPGLDGYGEEAAGRSPGVYGRQYVQPSPQQYQGTIFSTCD
jgi:hypothetical protein